MKFLERDLEDIICNATDEQLNNLGLPIGGKRYRQLKIGNYGIADLITVSRSNHVIEITVYELKKGPISYNALGQAARYKKGIEEYLSKYRNIDRVILVNMVLIGDEIDTDSNFVFFS